MDLDFKTRKYLANIFYEKVGKANDNTIKQTFTQKANDIPTKQTYTFSVVRCDRQKQEKLNRTILFGQQKKPPV